MAGLEFHQHVDVTVGAEIVPKDEAEQDYVIILKE